MGVQFHPPPLIVGGTELYWYPRYISIVRLNIYHTGFPDVQCDAIRWKQYHNWHFSGGYNFCTNVLTIIPKIPTLPYSCLHVWFINWRLMKNVRFRTVPIWLYHTVYIMQSVQIHVPDQIISKCPSTSFMKKLIKVGIILYNAIIFENLQH